MSPKRHKARLLKLLENLKNEVCSLLEDGHLQYPYKQKDEVKQDIENLVQEIERTGLAE